MVLASKCIAPYSGSGLLDTTACPAQNVHPKLSLFSKKYDPQRRGHKVEGEYRRSMRWIVWGFGQKVKTWTVQSKKLRSLMHKLGTSQKIKMAPKSHGGLEDDVPFQLGDFLGFSFSR